MSTPEKSVEQEALEREVLDIVIEQLQLDPSEASLEKSFSEDFGTDSLDLTELIMAFEARFGFEIPQKEAEKLHIIKDVVDYVQKNRSDNKSPPSA
ncbi:MAG: acyl carrier protein [Chlamydiota bacterium]|jgi:acyl carrier protein|nr:acyl carrier protein [Chlamydiota bacterium]